MGSTNVCPVTCWRSDLSRLDLGSERELSAPEGRWRRRPRVVVGVEGATWSLLEDAGANMMDYDVVEVLPMTVVEGVRFRFRFRFAIAIAMDETQGENRHRRRVMEDGTNFMSRFCGQCQSILYVDDSRRCPNMARTREATRPMLVDQPMYLFGAVLFVIIFRAPRLSVRERERMMNGDVNVDVDVDAVTDARMRWCWNSPTMTKGKELGRMTRPSNQTGWLLLIGSEKITTHSASNWLSMVAMFVPSKWRKVSQAGKGRMEHAHRSPGQNPETPSRSLVPRGCMLQSTLYLGRRRFSGADARSKGVQSEFTQLPVHADFILVRIGNASPAYRHSSCNWFTGMDPLCQCLIQWYGVRSTYQEVPT